MTSKVDKENGQVEIKMESLDVVILSIMLKWFHDEILELIDNSDPDVFGIVNPDQFKRTYENLIYHMEATKKELAK